jgi:hypothetical protein
VSRPVHLAFERSRAIPAGATRPDHREERHSARYLAGVKPNADLNTRVKWA